MVDQAADHSYSSSRIVLQNTSAPTLALRNDARLSVILPNSRAMTIQLDAEGSYLCVSLAGDGEIGRDGSGHALPANRLHILRQPAEAPRRTIAFYAPKTLAAVVYFSPRWCQSCPRGPHCKVAHFLLRGGEMARSTGDQAFDLDERGRTIAQALLGAHIDDDADVLAVEQSILALLAWAFARSENPAAVATSKSVLHPQAAMKVRQAAEIIRRRFDNPPTISELSAVVGLNETDLKRCFKCLYGKGIASYSRERRLETARDLLAYSSLGVATIAIDVGFTNPSQFARAFRQQYGVNPSDYRRSTP